MGRPGPVALGIGLTIVFAMTAYLVYRDVLPAQFVYDDARLFAEPLIGIRSIGDVVEILTTPGLPRRVGMASLALNRLFGGPDPWAFRATNLVLHITNGLLLVVLLSDLARRLPTENRPSRAGMALGGAVWLLHPVQTQGVSYVWQRFTCLATSFVLLTLLAFVRALQARGRARQAWAAGCAFAGILAFGTKENAGMLPVLLLIVHRVFFAEEEVSKRAARWLFLSLGLFFFGVAAWYLGPRWIEMILRDSERRGFTPLQRILTEWRVIAHYLSLLMWPHPSRLRLDYEFPLSTSLLDPPTTALSGLAILIATLLGARWTRTRPLEGFAVLWFLANLVIESSFIPLDLVYEHRIYLPSTLLLAVGVARVHDLIPSAVLRVGVGLILAVGLGYWSHERNQVWRDPVSFWQDNAAKSPSRALVHWNLGRAYLVRGEYENARRATAEALRLDPRLTGARSNLAVIAMAEGRDGEARSILEELLHMDPGYQPALVNLGLVRLRLGEAAAALPLLVRAADQDPDDDVALRALVAAQLALGEPRRAVAAARLAVGQRPSSALRRALLGAGLLEAGDREGARAALTEALRLDARESLALEYQARLAGAPSEPSTLLAPRVP
jgi:Flp pilus assembly protein TadD